MYAPQKVSGNYVVPLTSLEPLNKLLFKSRTSAHVKFRSAESARLTESMDIFCAELIYVLKSFCQKIDEVN